MNTPSLHNDVPGNEGHVRPSFWAGCLRWFAGRSPGEMLLIGLALIGLIGLLDYLTGPQLSSSLFYLIPVFLVARFGRPGGGLLAALSATGAWLTADLLSPQAAFGHAFIPYWNAAMRLGVFMVTVGLVSALRSANASLEERVRERTTALETEVLERRQLEKRVLEISDREQARIGQDLHDGLCQHLVSTAFSANLLHQRLAAENRLEAAPVNDIAVLLDDAITQARQLARGLYPVRLEADGLELALQELAASTSSRHGIPCTMAASDDIRLPDNATAIHLYRIAQEAVNNAVKHARPHHIRIHLVVEAHGLRLQVEDDGLGIHAHSHNPEGMGLNIMEYRARMIGGSLQVASSASGGTVVSCHIAIPV